MFTKTCIKLLCTHKLNTNNIVYNLTCRPMLLRELKDQNRFKKKLNQKTIIYVRAFANTTSNPAYILKINNNKESSPTDNNPVITYFINCSRVSFWKKNSETKGCLIKLLNIFFVTYSHLVKVFLKLTTKPLSIFYNHPTDWSNISLIKLEIQTWGYIFAFLVNFKP